MGGGACRVIGPPPLQQRSTTRVLCARPPHLLPAGADVLLRTIGLADEAVAILETHGWDAFLAHQAALRRARRRLPWRLGKADASCEQSLESQQAMEGGGGGRNGGAEPAGVGAAAKEALSEEGEQEEEEARPAPSCLARLLSGHSPLAWLLQAQASVRGPLQPGGEPLPQPPPDPGS